ncbi:hypothetical protein BU16DRAFT_574315 [Lophium mytilinum]|uniref:tRNA 4-demethylwyosine synthase (AdoMet-dependent) n=1 Tax=Lophium mytilinum TaxID=390894 RepID=A0A6A6QJI7_9PEZI|nr:hypothetical protein BU16DRAFT_574315 [Lophium mytilinum]
MDFSTRLGQLPTEIFEIWHAHRLPVILSAISLIAAIRLIQNARRKRERLSLSPAPASPAEKDEDISLPWQLEGRTEKQTLLPEIRAEDSSPPLVQLRNRGPKTVKGVKLKSGQKQAKDFDHTTDKIQPLIFFSSLAATTEVFATKFAEELATWIEATSDIQSLLRPELLDLSYIEYDDYFISPPKTDPNTKYVYLVLLPSYDIDTVLDIFLENLQETHNDFRIDTAPLSGLLGYSVFGFGDKEGWPTEEEGFCSQAKQVDKWLAKLTGRKRAFPLGMGDVKGAAQERLNEWRMGVQEVVIEIAAGRGLGDGVAGSGNPVESDEEDMEDVDNSDEESTKARKPQKTARVDDLEDLGRMINTEEAAESAPLAIDFTTYKSKRKTPAVVQLKEMVPTSSPTHASLTKQGYSIIGSHSGVKICRWTKSALRGRGSCYKYSFYGIASHLCMEATPSLSCSNKCVFCWRHGTNPVGTTWRWITDAPEVIFDGITTAHYKKIKAMKGVPGVRAERFAEAMRIRHCALSLVGEPIFYPHINELVAIMHANRISTFLVCNAQHPAQLEALIPVTQLYVSIDASNKDSLRKIDRPLHRDFWERFCACLDILKRRRLEQRTVFRLTLVKNFNMADEVRGYADLVERALPGFVEVKGVTYCGTSAAGGAGITMENVPFYEEVAAFVEALAKELSSRGLHYGIAAEHAHSCCVLLADEERFLRNGKWATRIDFEKFFELYEGGGEWRPEDYIGGETPEWALWGNGGFDPRDTRVWTKGKNKGRVIVGGGGVGSEKAKKQGVETLWNQES